MKTIRDVDFGPVWTASGARGFFGEGYWFHRVVPGLNWDGSCFVAKTTTLLPRTGNMPLAHDWKPRSLFPSCIVVHPWAGHALNAIGLSGPGAEDLFATGEWQRRTKPFMLSFMPVGESSDERLEETKAFARLLSARLELFQAPVGLQINLSCPNTGHESGALMSEADTLLRVVRDALPSLPLIAKLNVLWPVDLASSLVVDAICISNTIPWGTLPGRIDWHDLFGSEISPLDHLGGGGLSGAPLLPLVAAWIDFIRTWGYEGHVNACGGILRPDDVNVMVAAGADSVSLGTIAMLRGWRLSRTIKRAQQLLKSTS